MKNYGERIRKARKSKKMTMKQLAEAIGTVESNVSMYEREERLPPVDKIEAMARVLEVSPIYITGWSSMTSVGDAMLTEMARNISMFKTLSTTFENGLSIRIDAEKMACTVIGKKSEFSFSTNETEIKKLIDAIVKNDNDAIGLLIADHMKLEVEDLS